MHVVVERAVYYTVSKLLLIGLCRQHGRQHALHIYGRQPTLELVVVRLHLASITHNIMAQRLLLLLLLPCARAARAAEKSCTESVQWHPGIQLHDMEGAGDMGSKGNLSAVECASWCCKPSTRLSFY